jgi:acetyl esterase/lipase
MKKILFLLLVSGHLFAQATEYTTVSNIAYYKDNATADAYTKQLCVLDLYYPKNIKNFATIIWFHGGGLTEGSKEIPEALTNKGYAVIGVGYRLSPKVKGKQCIEDAAAAVAWVFKNVAKYGGDDKEIFISGHSAGGYLACMVGLDKRWLKKYDIDANQIAGLIPLSGQMITHFTIRKENNIPDTTPVIDEYAPLTYVRADAPPLLLITGDRELEMLGRYEENAYMMRMMKLCGHKETRLLELDGYGHQMTAPAFPLLLKEVKRIIDKKPVN